MTVSRASVFTLRASFLSAAVGLSAVGALAQDPGVPAPNQPPVSKSTQTSADGKVTTTTTSTVDATGKPVQSVTSTLTFNNRGKKKPAATKDKIVQSTDTKRAEARNKKINALAGVDSKLPDKQLYDKALYAISKGRYDVARLDLQTMLNTYPNSEYQMRAKLAVADSWYKEGGTAALTQAESEYADFRVFFPNAPEAAEAQMRIGDIYFRQMDRPDRDYAKALHAEEEYRRMLTDYPDSSLVPRAKQSLRDVQEVLATREADIGSFYGTHDNYAAVIARLQTVVDTYPLYSHMDDVLIGLGDAYEAQARFIRSRQGLPEGGKAALEQLYDNRAADYYRKVVLEHAAAAHVDDAKDRLAAMGLPIPEPTPAQLAASVKLENSRNSYKISDRVTLMFLHKADVVTSAHVDEPTLVDPKATIAPNIVKKSNEDFMGAFAKGSAAAPAVAAVPAVAPTAAVAPVTPSSGTAAPLAFEDVPTAGNGATPSTGSVLARPAGSVPVSNGTGMNVEIITHAPGSTPDAEKANPLKTVRPADTSALPDVEKAGAAPDVPNQVTGKTAPAQVPNANGKNPKPVLDKKDESSSKTKKKKGLGKINPF